MKQLESLGNQVEARLDELDRRIDSPLRASFFGVLLGFGVTAAGIATFLLVLAVLVNVFA